MRLLHANRLREEFCGQLASYAVARGVSSLLRLYGRFVRASFFGIVEFTSMDRRYRITENRWDSGRGIWNRKEERVEDNNNRYN